MTTDALVDRLDDAMVSRAEAAMADYWNDPDHETRCEPCRGTGEDRANEDWCGDCGGAGFIHAGTDEGALRAALTAALTGETPCRAGGVEVGDLNGRTLYVDLDGVMADFDSAFPAIFGLDHRDMADDDMWLRINGHASFFRDLDPMPGALEFFRAIAHLNPVILTACPKSNYAHVATQKRAWVREHLSATCLVLPVLGGRHKPLFMHAAGDILIDDFRKNTEAWAAAGGVPILHRDFDTTRRLLAEAIAKEAP